MADLIERLRQRCHDCSKQTGTAPEDCEKDIWNAAAEIEYLRRELGKEMAERKRRLKEMQDTTEAMNAERKLCLEKQASGVHNDAPHRRAQDTVQIPPGLRTTDK